MRSVLFTIPLDARLDLGALGKFPVFGAGILLALWGLFGVLFAVLLLRRGALKELGLSTGIVWGIVAAAIILLPHYFKTLPIHGFGTMLFLAVIATVSYTSRRLRREGLPTQVARDSSWDLAMWIFVSGLLGARIYFIVENRASFFAAGQSSDEILRRVVNLPDGGLVLYGGLILAPIAYVLFCLRRGFNILAFGDIVISSVFVGLAFGRLGCMLHGCCYGDLCSLPWGVKFPEGSVPYQEMVARGLQSGSQPYSLALHPTQLYDSLNALLLAALTFAYYPLRRRTGEVMAVGWLLYPMNRFVIEWLRFDEPTVGRTGLTLAQIISLGLIVLALAFLIRLQRRPVGLTPILRSEPPSRSADSAAAIQASRPAASRLGA
jgi:phosphatidylglycerol---prolipoprotein diacylglyceryl transferase